MRGWWNSGKRLSRLEDQLARLTQDANELRKNLDDMSKRLTEADARLSAVDESVLALRFETKATDDNLLAQLSNLVEHDRERGDRIDHQFADADARIDNLSRDKADQQELDDIAIELRRLQIQEQVRNENLDNSIRGILGRLTR